MEGMGGADSMMGLLPMVIGAGIVMKVTDRMLGDPQPQKKSRKRSKTMARSSKAGLQTRGLNKRLFAQGKGVGASARKTAKKISDMASPVRLGGSNSDPSKTGIFKAVKRASKKSKGGIY